MRSAVGARAVVSLAAPDLLNNNIDPLLSCGRIRGLIAEVKDFVCVSSLNSFYNLSAGNAMTGLFYLVRRSEARASVA